MSEQVGWRGLLNNLKKEAPQWASQLPALPRLVHLALSQHDTPRLLAALDDLQKQGKERNRWLSIIALLLLSLLVALVTG
jgi:ubiquinone biosynthesis protein